MRPLRGACALGSTAQAMARPLVPLLASMSGSSGGAPVGARRRTVLCATFGTRVPYGARASGAKWCSLASRAGRVPCGTRADAPRTARMQRTRRGGVMMVVVVVPAAAAYQVHYTGCSLSGRRFCHPPSCQPIGGVRSAPKLHGALLLRPAGGKGGGAPRDNWKTGVGARGSPLVLRKVGCFSAPKRPAVADC